VLKLTFRELAWNNLDSPHPIAALAPLMKQRFTFALIDHGSETYEAAVRLRDDILKNPMGIQTTTEDRKAEVGLTHVAGFVDGALQATCVLVTEGSALRMKRVAVARAFQDQGIGSAMLRFCESHARAIGATELCAHARDTAVRFYEKAGYVAEGEYFDEVGIPHRMVRKML
jgi:GNAT superfamily N-acetyltransferase